MATQYSNRSVRPGVATFPPRGFTAIARLNPEASAQVLARFDAGAPALIERQVGTGRVLLWMSTLDLSWSDLPLKPVFLPFIHRAARHLSAYAEPLPWWMVGQVLDASFGESTLPLGGAAVLTPSGRQVPLDEEGSDVLELTEGGFYELRTGTSESVTAVVASNVDSAESDLTAMDPQDIVAAATTGVGGDARSSAAALPPPPEAQERSQRLWWYLLFLGIVLLGADTLISEPDVENLGACTEMGVF